MKRAALWGAALGLALALLLFAPAAWLAQLLASQTDGKVRLLAPRGTVWDGSALLVISGGEGSTSAIALPSRISWSIAPGGLGMGMGMGLTLSSTCCTPHTPAHIGLQATNLLQGASGLVLQFDAAALNLPAEVLAGLGAPWNTLQLGGELMLSSQALIVHWSQGKGILAIQGAASLQVKDVQTALSTVRPLGTYLLTLQGSQLTLSTPSPADALQLVGTGQLGASPRFQGTATATVGREAALSNLLHIIGQRQTGEAGLARSVFHLGSTQ